MAIGGEPPDPRRDKLDALLSGHMARVDVAPPGSVTVTDLRPALGEVASLTSIPVGADSPREKKVARAASALCEVATEGVPVLP